MAWLTLSPSGVLTGTPTSSEYDTVTVQVQDSVGNTSIRTFALTVQAVNYLETDGGAPIVLDDGTLIAVG